MNAVSSLILPPLPHRRRPGAARRAVVAAVAVVLVAGLVQVPAYAEPPVAFGPPTPQPVLAVPVTPVGASRPAAAAMPDAAGKPAPVWPAAGQAEVDVPSATAGSYRAGERDTGSRGTVRAGTLPVFLGPAEPSMASPAAVDSGRDLRAGGPAAPGRVRVQVLDRAAGTAAGVSGMLLRVGRADANTATGRVKLGVDYSAFATGYGADWSTRLRLVLLPECALSTPRRRDCVGTPANSSNDVAADTVSAVVSVGAGGTLLGLDAATSGPAGDYAATSLQPSSTWSAGGNSGTFSWSYPMRVPPAAGGPVPQVALSYSSQSVDGRHAASNNQPSWVGEGFEGWPGGFIERRYKSCAKDMDGAANNNTETGDLCFSTDNATLNLAGHSGELIYNAAEDRWRLRGDDASRIERKTGAANGDNDGEYWVVTTTDATQYWFGVNHLPGWAGGDPVTNAAWTTPVFGNHPGEPCHSAAFADSDCVQGWRWNLDYVVDLSGNSASYWYGEETNKYARNNDPDDDATYTRGGYLTHVAYGTRRDAGTDSVLDTPAPAKVVLATAQRCLSDCASHDEAHWPDTPWDADCTASSCDTYSPTFWTTNRLSTITTQVWGATSYRDVERWTLTHTFPDPGDGTRAGLWLAKISHTGLVGVATTVPDVEFTGVQLANRVDTIDFAAAMNWWRIAMIRNETGGTVSVTYSPPDCVAGQPMPAPHDNTRRCYPVRWTPEGYQDPVTDWFHKYVVTIVYETDHTGGVPPAGSPRIAYTYTYLDGAGWHYADDDGLTQPEDKTWSQWRGYARVGVSVGDPGEQTYTETRFLRGMHGDKQPTGTRTVMVAGTGVPDVADEDAYAGMTRESTVFDGPGGAVVSRQVSQPWQSPPTATRTINATTVHARFVGTAASHGRVVLDAGRGEAVTTTATSFDAHGMVTQVDDLGDASTAGDEQCTKTDFEPRNTTAWLLDRVHRVQSYAVECDDTAGTLTDADVIGETRTWYDGAGFETIPTRGLATRTEQMSAFNAGASTFTTVARAGYDSHGRVTQAWNAVNATATTSYTPAAGGPVTATTLTNHFGHVVATTVDPAWGIPVSTVDANAKRTDLAYDGLGRLSAVWLPGRAKATQTANLTFSYLLRTDAATAVSTSRLDADEDYVTSHALFDGLLRTRQTQAPSPSGGRLLTDSFYDTAGRQVKTYGTYYALGAPDTTLVTATQPTDVPNQTRTVHDGAGRATASIFQPYDTQRWRSTTFYGGDRVDVTPPAGGTATSTVSDARGRTVALRQYHGPTPTPGSPGSWDDTTYTFNRKGQLAAVSDPAGNDWTYLYDIRGRQVQASDPDRGATVSTFDNASRLSSTTDARGKKLVYLYDALDRKRAVYENQVGGNPRAQWGYDTIAKGQLTFTSRFIGTALYQVKVLGYTDAYQPTGTQVTIPAAETGLTGAYNFLNNWNDVDRSLESVYFPSTGGDLPSETVSYGYNNLAQPTTVDSLYGTPGTQLSYVADTAYNALGQADQVTLDTDDLAGGRVWQSYTRELDTGRLTGVRTDRDSLSPNTLADLHYSHDDAGNITKVTDTAADPVDDTQCYEHDQLRRLTAAWTPTTGDCATTPTVGALGGPAPYWHSWTFDTVGNRLSQVVHAAGGDATTSYTYPTPGGAQPHTLSATSGAATGQYRYDPAGNTTCRPAGTTPNTCPAGAGNQTLTWDPEGHLATSTDTAGTTSYIYDADGNRLVRRDPTGKTLYLPGQEIRYTTATATTACTRYYSHAGAIIASRTAAGLTWLSSDHQGTAQVAVNQATSTADTRRQTPYGTPRGGTPTWPNPRGFVGGSQDNTGLTHLGAREYDPTTGRFISVDPVQDLTDPQQWHGYTYANNSPVTLSDPDGLKPYDDTSKGSGDCGYGCGGGSQPYYTTVVSLSDYAYRADPLGFEHGSDSAGVYYSENLIREYICYRTGCPQWVAEAKQAERMIMTFISLMPYVGSPAALSLALEDLINGDYKSAAINAAGAIPFAGLLKVGKVGDEVLDVATAAGRACSFTANTEVVMADGTTKPISQVEIGDEVLATDPENGKTRPKRVTQLWVHQDTVVDLNIDGQPLTTTEDHPFWNATDQQWQHAQTLDPGDLLLTPNGTTVPVGGLEWLTSHVEAAYNLTVADIHTYYVLAGTTPVLVHNTGPLGCGTAAADVGNFKPIHGIDPNKAVDLRKLSNDDLINSFNNPADDGFALVRRDGQIMNGHHRIAELQRRVQNGDIASTVKVRIDEYTPDMPVSGFWY